MGGEDEIRTELNPICDPPEDPLETSLVIDEEDPETFDYKIDENGIKMVKVKLEHENNPDEFDLVEGNNENFQYDKFL